MRAYLVKTHQGLVPATEADQEALDSLTVGRTYGVDIKSTRNVRFHNKYMSLMRTAWEYMKEKQQEFFRNSFDTFRKTIEVASGCCERVYNINRHEWLEVPKSIAFDKMSEAEFRTLYERVKDTLFATVLKHVGQEEFLQTLNNY